MASTQSLVAREARLFVFAAALLVLLVFHYFGGVAALLLAPLPLLLGFLFRDPARDIPASPLAIVSPVDGIIETIGYTEDPYLNRRAVRIGIQMGLFDVYTVRSPVEGKIMQQWASSKGIQDEQGEGDTTLHFAEWIRTNENDDMVMIVYARPSGRRMRCYVHAGERVGQGQRCGYIRFGARVDVLIPENSRTSVQLGQSVKAGEDIVAHLVHG